MKIGDKEFEILDKGNSKFKLTVTPTRVTLKLTKDYPRRYLLEERVYIFALEIAKSHKMANCEQSFRGMFAEEPTTGKLCIMMATNGKPAKTRIKYIEGEV